MRTKIWLRHPTAICVVTGTIIGLLIVKWIFLPLTSQDIATVILVRFLVIMGGIADGGIGFITGESL